MTDYMMAKVILAKQNPGEKHAIEIHGETQAFELVSILAKLEGRYSLTDSSDRECVDAKSYIGVLYFMVVHPYDAFLKYEEE